MILDSGVAGNERPLASTHEFWCSPQLETNLAVTRNGPRQGLQVVRLSSVSRSESEAQLFEVPLASPSKTHVSRVSPSYDLLATRSLNASGTLDPMVFVLDNYDSFTYNLVQYMGELGVSMTIRRNDEVSVDEVENLAPERILISPGPCTPQEAGISIELIRRFTGIVPILGVCLGHQALGAAFGGDVVRASQLMHGKTSPVEHDGRTIFAGLASPMTCTRYHSLIVSNKHLPKELEVSARTADGVIMGLRHRQYPVEGVQFHPESVLTTDGKRLIRNFLELGAVRAASKSADA